MARFCRVAVENLAYLDVKILDLLDALPKGYQMMEIFWEVSEGDVHLKNLN